MIKAVFDDEKKNSATWVEVIFSQKDHGLKIDQWRLPQPTHYDEEILVTFRPYRQGVNMVIRLEVDGTINDGWYRSIVGSLLGWRFYRRVRSTIKFQRKHGGRSYSPLIKPAWMKAPTTRVIASNDEASERLMRLSEADAQIAIQ